MNPRLKQTQRLLALIAAAALASPALGVVVVSDGFGDANRNNDGVIDQFDWDLDGNGTVGPYEAPVFPGSSINEIDTPTDVLDTGIAWHGAGGFVSSASPDTGLFNEKIYSRIVDDTAGLAPEGVGIDSGLALGLNSKGRGSTLTGFFGQTIALGANVGDQVKASVDLRLWDSSPNLNTPATPSKADLRFGLYQDTDGQIGQTNPFAGPSFTSAVWGQDDGTLDGTLAGAGAGGDHGWAARIKIGPGYPSDGADAPTPSGGTTGPRIFEETNEDPSGVDPQRKRLLQGSDDDFVAKPDAVNPNFTSLLAGKVYNLALTLERATDTNPGDTILATFTVNNLTDATSFSFSGLESLTDGASDPGSGGIQSDSWDYFALRVSSANSFGEQDFDTIIDNFMVETFEASAAIPGDYNNSGLVEQGDLDLVLLNWGTAGTPAGWVNEVPVGIVDQAELDGVLLNWGNTSEPAGSAVPEPATAALLSLGGLALLRRRVDH